MNYYYYYLSLLFIYPISKLAHLLLLIVNIRFSIDDINVHKIWFNDDIEPARTNAIINY